MTSADAKLERHFGPHIYCDLCSGAGGWILRGPTKQLALCNQCAACVVFSNTDTTAALLGHLPGKDREEIVMKLWMCRRTN